MTKEKKTNWFLKHWFISIILAIVFIGIISGIANGGKEEAPTSIKDTPKAVEEISPMDKTSNSITDTPKEIETISVMDKISGFTMDDCYEICDKYPMQINTNVCYGNCGMYGKPSSKLDTYCLASIQSVKNSQ